MNLTTLLDLAGVAVRGYEAGRHIGNIVSSDTAVAGRLSGPGGCATHVLTLPRHGSHEVRLTQPLWADYDLYILGTDQQLIAEDEGNSNPSVVALTGSGQCIAVVRSQYGAGPYTLTISEH